ncbi:transcriptional regulator, IclR family [Natronorubrum sediminis]|uniref:Transcriptional regulator, IclR family n=1 Tax=Natronorubrum sediminis TaxID=640943 RepID=A0A1H6G419_9EURY|nr:IclR family transcriptional regulator [Natronorubrum sediminis]SEH17836.1 transcriptional regulator, IclR family [Natronorubrum sediminis]
MIPEHTQDGPVRAIDRALSVLDVLREINGGTFTEIANQVDLPKSTLHNHLVTLERNHYIVKRDDEYHLGLQFLNFGEFVKRQRPGFEEAKPVVEELAESTGERVQFVAEEHGHSVYVHIAEGDRAVKSRTSVGQLGGAQLHATAAGKSILAFLSDDRRDAVLDYWGMSKITDNTIQDREQLLDDLEEIRERRYAINREEHIDGLYAVGVPVIGPDETVIGAISISGPTHRMRGERLNSKLPEVLLGASNELELNINFSESHSR